jgi:hypothetical protein
MIVNYMDSMNMHEVAVGRHPISKSIRPF